MMRMQLRFRRMLAPAAAAVGGASAGTAVHRSWSWPAASEEEGVICEEERVIREEEMRQHNSALDAWMSFKGGVYDITPFIPHHPACKELAWAERLAGRRLEHFLGAGAFGPAHAKYLPASRCIDDGGEDKRRLERLLEPFRVGKFEPLPRSAAAQSWPKVDAEAFELRIELADGRQVKALSLADLRALYPKNSEVVVLKCDSGAGYSKQREWAGVRIRDLLSEHAATQPWDPLVTFVGVDGFGYSMFRSRAVLDDVLLAYEQRSSPLDVEDGGPLRLVQHGQHAKWVEKIILE